MLIFKMTIMLLSNHLSLEQLDHILNQHQSSDMEIIIQIQIINQIH